MSFRCVSLAAASFRELPQFYCSALPVVRCQFDRPLCARLTAAASLAISPSSTSICIFIASSDARLLQKLLAGAVVDLKACGHVLRERYRRRVAGRVSGSTGRSAP